MAWARSFLLWIITCDSQLIHKRIHSRDLSQLFETLFWMQKSYFVLENGLSYPATALCMKAMIIDNFNV